MSTTTWVAAGDTVRPPQPELHYVDNEATGIRIFADLTTELLAPLADHTPLEAPPMTTADTFLDESVAASDDVTLRDDLLGAIRAFENDRPRSRQTWLGPSEIGDPCARKLAYKLGGEPEVNASTDKWAAQVGTAVHTMLEEAMRHTNHKLGRTRFIVEQKVVAWGGQGGTGSVDVFDVDTGSVVDWKVPGPTRLAHYKKHGPSQVYRNQVHVYGQGYARLGFDVRHVGIMFLPRVGVLAGASLWREPYNPDVVKAVFDRRDEVQALAAALNVKADPTMYALIPANPSSDCAFCPFHSPNPRSPVQCAGAKA